MFDASAMASVADHHRARYKRQTERSENPLGLFGREPAVAARLDNFVAERPRTLGMHIVEVPQQTGRFGAPARVCGDFAGRADGVFRESIRGNSLTLGLDDDRPTSFAHHTGQNGLVLATGTPSRHDAGPNRRSAAIMPV